MAILQGDVSGKATRFCITALHCSLMIISYRTEFVPFVFQIMSQMLELQIGQEIPPSYTALLPSLLTPALWQTRSNVPALVRLLQAFLAKGNAQIVNTSTLQSLLGIYQQLIASRVNDEYGFELLLSIFRHVDR